MLNCIRSCTQHGRLTKSSSLLSSGMTVWCRAAADERIDAPSVTIRCVHIFGARKGREGEGATLRTRLPGISCQHERHFIHFTSPFHPSTSASVSQTPKSPRMATMRDTLDTASKTWMYSPQKENRRPTSNKRTYSFAGLFDDLRDKKRWKNPEQPDRVPHAPALGTEAEGMFTRWSSKLGNGTFTAFRDFDGSSPVRPPDYDRH